MIFIKNFKNLPTMLLKNLAGFFLTEDENIVRRLNRALLFACLIHIGTEEEEC